MNSYGRKLRYQITILTGSLFGGTRVSLMNFLDNLRQTETINISDYPFDVNMKNVLQMYCMYLFEQYRPKFELLHPSMHNIRVWQQQSDKRIARDPYHMSRSKNECRYFTRQTTSRLRKQSFSPTSLQRASCCCSGPRLCERTFVIVSITAASCAMRARGISSCHAGRLFRLSLPWIQASQSCAREMSGQVWNESMCWIRQTASDSERAHSHNIRSSLDNIRHYAHEWTQCRQTSTTLQADIIIKHC